MGFEDLSPELQNKARACKTPEEILDLAKAEGYELSEVLTPKLCMVGYMRKAMYWSAEV